VLRGQEVLIPCDRRIQRLRLEDGADLGSMPAQTLDDLPLGILYVRGDQLLVAGPERLYALVGADAVFAELREQLARQPTAEAYAKRGGMLAGLGRHVEAVADLREVWKRQRGSAGEGAARARLTEELYRAAEQDPGAADRCRAEARDLAVSDKERAEAAWRVAQASERKGDTQAALALYAAQLTSPDARIRCGPDWEASARLLAAHRIRTLLARDEAGLRALLEKPAEQALARLGPQAERAALVEVATLFAGTAAGKAAALQAAQAAAGRNDFGIAAAILQRALALSPASFRTELAGELARLYERMKWPRGVARLREEWPRLGGGAPLPGLLASVATNAAPPAGASLPLPPWRLRWKKGPNMNGNIIVPSGLLYSQLSGTVGQVHVVNFGCLSLETGMPRWQKNGSGAFTVPETSLDNGFTSVGGDRIQLREWEAGQLILSLTGSLDIWSGAVITNDVFCNSFNSNAYGGVFAALLSEVSVRVVSRDTVLMGEDMLTGTCAWMLAGGPDPGVWRGGGSTVVGTMLAPDGSPSVFPQTGHFLARTRDNREHVALDPMTGAVLSRRSLDVANNRDVRRRLVPALFGRRQQPRPRGLDRARLRRLERNERRRKADRQGSVGGRHPLDVAAGSGHRQASGHGARHGAGRDPGGRVAVAGWCEREGPEPVGEGPVQLRLGGQQRRCRGRRSPRGKRVRNHGSGPGRRHTDIPGHKQQYVRNRCVLRREHDEHLSRQGPVLGSDASTPGRQGKR
jgi:hypothetical protein